LRVALLFQTVESVNDSAQERDRNLFQFASKEPKLPLSATHTYAEPGEYRVVVKVIDILGNNTTKTVKVKVK
jgi:hypothetical protein